VGWAITYLYQTKLLERQKRSGLENSIEQEKKEET
jgi:hypothetical protein